MLRYFRTKSLLDAADADGMLSWQGSGGFSIDASVRIDGEDRAGLERLHAPAGIASLASNDSRLAYRFPRPRPDGRTELRLSQLEPLARLARFIPPPRVHRHRYYAARAPNAANTMPLSVCTAAPIGGVHGLPLRGFIEEFRGDPHGSFLVVRTWPKQGSPTGTDRLSRGAPKRDPDMSRS